MIIDKKTLTLMHTVANVNICRLVNETRAIALVEAGTQANQFASAIDRVSNITFTENRAGKSFFFLITQKRLVL